MNQEDKQHQDNLALLREGRGVTVGSNYFTSVKDYCAHHELEIPEIDQEREPQETPGTAALEGFERHFQRGESGEVRTVLLGEWREAVETGDEAREILVISPEQWQESVQPKLDEVQSLKEASERLQAELVAIKGEAVETWLPQDLKERLVAIKGVGPALADAIVAALTGKSEPG